MLKSFLIATAVFAALLPLAAQSLSEVAKAEEARRKTVKGKAKVYTNDSLRGVDGGEPPAPPPAATPQSQAAGADATAKPAGPGAKGGRRNGVDANAWAIWKWANDPDTAKAFVVDWYAQWQEWGKVTDGYNSPPLLDMWKKPMPGLEDPNFQIMQEWRELAFVAGWQGPFHKGIEEVNATFVVPNMFARAARGETPDAAMKWADEEYKRIFQKHGIG